VLKLFIRVGDIANTFSISAVVIFDFVYKSNKNARARYFVNQGAKNHCGQGIFEAGIFLNRLAAIIS
jgi:hypothetical protein